MGNCWQEDRKAKIETTVIEPKIDNNIQNCLGMQVPWMYNMGIDIETLRENELKTEIENEFKTVNNELKDCNNNIIHF